MGGAARPEWSCSNCQTNNWADRPMCRRCGQCVGGHAGAQGPLPNFRIVPPPPRAWGPPPNLGAVAKAAEAAGASSESLAALQRDAEQRRSAGGRLDSARAKAARAARVADEARAAAQAAEKRATEAEMAERAAAKELAEVEASLAAAPAESASGEKADNFVQSVQNFLDTLEQSPVPGIVGQGPQLPARALEAMAELRRRIDGWARAAQRDQGAENAGDERRTEAGGTESQYGGSPADADQDTLMGALDSAEEDDDAAMLAIARRLKRTRRS